MIVRFDTPELAKRRFEELKEEHPELKNPAMPETEYYFERRIEEKVFIYYLLKESQIDVYVRAYPLEHLTTAMKIVNLMSEV